MKSLIPCVLLLGILMPHLAADELPAKEKVEYRRLEKPDDRVQGVVRQLQALKLENLIIKDLALSAALGVLREKIVGTKVGGVIDFVIRGSEKGEKVSIHSERTTYAEALDQICEQSGRVWTIEFMDPSGRPVLIIKKDNRRQAAP